MRRRAPLGSTVAERLQFFSVDDSASGCRLWTGSKNRKGYGRMYIAGMSRRVHRVAWELRHGPIPDGMTIHHTCFQTSCVNPGHMELMTSAQNAHLNFHFLKTHCKQGHEFTAENTRVRWNRINGNPSRVCRRCQREAQAAYRSRVAA